MTYNVFGGTLSLTRSINHPQLSPVDFPLSTEHDRSATAERTVTSTRSLQYAPAAAAAAAGTGKLRRRRRLTVLYA